MPSSDDYAREVIRAGRDMGITPRGIVIGLATVIVESGLPIRMWANQKIPESLALPHDSVGNDGYSCGLQQQQLRKGPTGEWWWGDLSTIMDPYKSSRLFYGRLAKLDYNNTANTPGSYAQAVQGSAFPDRYDQRMADAQKLYDRLSGGHVATFDYGITDVMHGYNPNTGDNCTGNSNGPRAQTSYLVVHTQQAHADAVSLANFCNNSWQTQPDNPVSYNLVVDDKKTIEVVPVNEGPWSAAEANDIAVHLCFAGSFAEWSTAQWESTDASDGLNEDAMLTRGAKAIAAACQQYNIPVVYAGDGGKSGWPVLPKGIVGHRDFGARGGGHKDPGDGFPMSPEFLRRVQSFMPGAPVVTPPVVTPPATPVAKKFPDEWTDRDLLIEILRQQRGYDLKGWPQLGKDAQGNDRTLIDALAVLLEGK